MSAKGLPPAVRLDRIPVPYPHPHHLPLHTHNTHYTDQRRQTPFRYNPYPSPNLSHARIPDISSYTCIEVPTAMKPTGTVERGLTMITPASSRAVTPSPVNLDPIVPQAAAQEQTKDKVKAKVETKIRRVELEVLKPSVQTLDADTSEGAGVGIQEFQHAGRSITFPPLQPADGLRLRPESTAPRPDDRRGKDRERGRPLERVRTRFGARAKRNRPAPYDSHPSSCRVLLRAVRLEEDEDVKDDVDMEEEESVRMQGQAVTGQGQGQTLENNIDPETSPSPPPQSRSPATQIITMPAQRHQHQHQHQQLIPTSLHTPPYLQQSPGGYGHPSVAQPMRIPTTPATTSQHPTYQHPTHQHPHPHPTRDGSTSQRPFNNSSPDVDVRPSSAIHGGADDLISLFSTEFKDQLEKERSVVRREREEVERAWEALRREREAMSRPREREGDGEEESEKMRALKAENNALRLRVAQLELALNVLQGGA
ncbi:hypothetical protein P691DRAFT_808674, partial [Macrolepiota fuliginosa MF-IS2]